MTFNGRDYATVMGGDLERDGMFLELDDVTAGGQETIAEWFYSDVDGSMTFTEYRGGTPAEVLAWFEGKATRLLPSRSDAV